MAGAQRLGELLHHLHRCSSWVLGWAMSLLCSLSRAYAHHQVTERVARSRCALRSGLNSLLLHVIYFAVVSFTGWGLLSALNVRAPHARPRPIDTFFTAVSAATVSSMSTVEMEVFTNAQLLVLTVLMFLGGEVFVSLIGLGSKWYKLRRQITSRHSSQRVVSHDGIELATPPATIAGAGDEDDDSRSSMSATVVVTDEYNNSLLDAKMRRRNAVRSLFYIVLGILAVVHVVGAVAVAAHVYTTPSARQTLRRKSLDVWTFAVFTTVSTFSSCGYMPTNENMAVFVRDVPLQLLLVPQALVGNTLFPPLLAACVWAAAAVTRREDLTEVDKKGREKVSNALFLAVNSRHTGESTVDLSTLAPAILVLFVLMMYLPPYTTWFPFEENSISRDHSTESQGIKILKSTVLSQLSYLTIFVIAICITERRKLKEDPLNFNVLSIVVEVVSSVLVVMKHFPSNVAMKMKPMLPNSEVVRTIKEKHKPTPRSLDLIFTSVSTLTVSSMATVEMEDFSDQQLAYGNVGYSLGYSCERMLKPDATCKAVSYGLVGKWTDEGKVIIILVMFLGRFKRFSLKGRRHP
nr:unnamed protein product [Digitaria exilis]